MLQPGDSFPVEGGTTLIPSALSTSTSSSTTAPTPSAAAASSGSNHSSMSGGAIAGIVIGALIAVSVFAALFFLMGRNRSLQDTVNRQSMAPSMSSLGMGKPGYLSPASPTPQPTPSGPIDYGNGTIFIPVKAADISRYSQSPVSGQQTDNLQNPLRNSGGSPGVTYLPVGHYDVGVQGTPQNLTRFVYKCISLQFFR
jgi:hypothetical protein